MSSDILETTPKNGAENSASEMSPLSEDFKILEEYQVENLVRAIRKNKLNLPLALILESHIPLQGLASSTLDILDPFLRFFISPQTRNILSNILSDREKLEKFLTRLSE
jgi:hypothetical protein